MYSRMHDVKDYVLDMINYHMTCISAITDVTHLPFPPHFAPKSTSMLCLSTPNPYITQSHARSAVAHPGADTVRYRCVQADSAGCASPRPSRSCGKFIDRSRRARWTIAP